MTTISSSFSRSRELILVDAEVTGRTGRTTEARLVLDTGAAATTLTPRIVEKLGYSRRDGYKDAKVHTAIGEDSTSKSVRRNA
jgi:predicted aspartyl protease